MSVVYVLGMVCCWLCLYLKVDTKHDWVYLLGIAANLVALTLEVL
jgi:hypothetical protein